MPTTRSLPEGDFSVTSEWTLGKQATVVPGGDPFSGAQQSLQLGNGAQAATPAICVGLDNPSIRFFIRDTGGNGKADLKVEVPRIIEVRDSGTHGLTINVAITA